eukprot:symbB.v1.2.024897.t1/scaffold2381.1/size80542/3
MSKNLAEASAASAAADADALRTARSPGGHSMAWQELLSVLPQLRGVSPKADFEGLCKISAEQLLPRSGAAPVRRLGEALAQVGLPLRGHADRGSEGAEAPFCCWVAGGTGCAKQCEECQFEISPKCFFPSMGI